MVPRAIVLLAAVAASSACLGAGPAPSTTPSSQGHDHEMKGRDMYVVAEDFSANPDHLYRFQPSSYTFRLDEHVNVTLSSATGNQNPHALVIDEFSFHVGPVDQGKSANGTFHASKTGSFKFYCDVGNHRALGMEGTLTIVP